LPAARAREREDLSSVDDRQLPVCGRECDFPAGARARARARL